MHVIAKNDNMQSTPLLDGRRLFPMETGEHLVHIGFDQRPFGIVFPIDQESSGFERFLQLVPPFPEPQGLQQPFRQQCSHFVFLTVVDHGIGRGKPGIDQRFHGRPGKVPVVDLVHVITGGIQHQGKTEDPFPGQAAFLQFQQRCVVDQVVRTEMDNGEIPGPGLLGQALLHKIGGHHIQPSLCQGPVDLVGGQIQYIESQRREIPPEMGDMPVHMDVSQRTEDPHVQFRGLCFGGGPGVVDDFPQPVDPAGDPGQEQFPLLRQLAAPPGTVDQCDAQGGLQVFDLGAEGGLGNVGLPGCPGKVPHPSIYNEAFQLCNGRQFSWHGNLSVVV